LPTASLDGIETRYEVLGDGPPLLMFSPGGFNAVVENWSELGVYKRLGLLERLPERYTCIIFDRRESGRSGGRVERIAWRDYVEQGRALLDHLDIDRAHAMGGCIGCSSATALAVSHPERVSSLVLYSPAGGARYRLGQHDRFVRHLAYVEEEGLDAVVSLARSHDLGFSKDPRIGPWGPVVRTDDAFADAYARLDAQAYKVTVTGMARLLFDRDSVPGVEPEDLLDLPVPTLIVPGEDTSHAPSAAHFLRECLPEAELWNAPVAEQTAETAPARILEFLDAVGARRA
jgi:pimeloyl-ACP methyl ester carboxylesterase